MGEFRPPANRGVGELVGKALAIARGDLRDWPIRCPSCGSEDLHYKPERDQYWCACGQGVTAQIAEEARYRRACVEVWGRDTPPTMGRGR